MQKRWMLFLFLFWGIAVQAQFFPAGFPQVTIHREQGENLCDNLFLANVRFILPSQKPSTAMILDREGDLIWYFQSTENVFDFRPQPGGYISMFVEPSYYLLDSAMNLAGTVDCQGRTTDFHALHISSDGRIFTICNQDSVMDLSGINTTGGLPGSTTGSVHAQTIQELTFNGNLVKEWQPWPWYSLSESDTIFFTQPTSYDFTHTNAIDFDGQNILLSHRALHGLTLIDWNSGVVLKKIGGKHSDYAMADSARFTGQHASRFAGPGQVSLYDNGAQSDPPLSRGMVLELNDSTTTATLARQYPNPAIISNSMGSFQVLPDRSVLVNHGRFSPNTGPNIELFTENGTRLADITLESTYFTYAAQCGEMPFEIRRPQILCTAISPDTLQLSVDELSNSFSWSTGEITSSILITAPGRYQVFVPRGIGVAGSAALEITNIASGCPVVSNFPQVAGNQPKPKLIGRRDVLGRPVDGLPAGMLIIEQYSDGSARKIWVD